MRRTFCVSLLFILVAFVLALPLIVSNTVAAESAPVGIKLVVHIMDIDQSQKSTQVTLTVYIESFPQNESQVAVSVGGSGTAYVLCNQTGQTLAGWNYRGESDPTTWLLEGVGETFPFDSYVLRFYVYSVQFVKSDNYTLTSEDHQASFTGGRAYSLMDLWATNDGLIPVSSVTSSELSFTVARSFGASASAILEFLLPTIACYYLLGSTLMLDPKKGLTDRLFVHVSLFVFVPIFLLAIRDFLPYRSTLSFPELLLVNLVLSNAIIAIFSIAGHLKAPDGPRVIRLYDHGISISTWDRLGIVFSLSFFIGIYWFTLWGKLSIAASLVFTYAVIPAYVCWMPFVVTRKQFVENWHRYMRAILLFMIPGIVLIVLWLLLH